VAYNQITHGTTAQRPQALDPSMIGFTYYDTDLDKPIFAKDITVTSYWDEAQGTRFRSSVTWVDATGADPDAVTPSAEEQ